MNEISQSKAKGCELDEFEAHRFLEHMGEALTVAEMRVRLRDIDIDFNRRVALIEYLMQKFGKVRSYLCVRTFLRVLFHRASQRL